LSSTATFAVAGDMERLSGTVAPAQAGQRVLLQRRVGPRWVTAARPRVADGSTFSIAHTFTTGRIEQWRAMVPTTKRNLGSSSPVVRIRIAPATGIHKIRHVVVIMQENRSFDSYFGTYPGADGIPGLAGNPGPLPCVPDPDRNMCETPFHDVTDRDAGGPHGHGTALADIADGRMDGFVGQAELGRTSYCKKHFDDPRCSFMPGKPDVMGYHDWREIPNYWEYANQFVLQDHMFESDSSWSLPEHL